MTTTYTTASIISNGTIVGKTTLGPVAPPPEPAGDFIHQPGALAVGFYL